MERPPKPDLLYGPRALSLDAFISSLEAWGEQGWDRAKELEAALRTWKNMMANPNYDLGEMASEFNAIVREVLP